MMQPAIRSRTLCFQGTAADRRVLVDGYTRVNINDRSVGSFAAKLDPGLQAEVAGTDVMFRKLMASDIPVRVTNPDWGYSVSIIQRGNHKKLLVADNIRVRGRYQFQRS